MNLQKKLSYYYKVRRNKLREARTKILSLVSRGARHSCIHLVTQGKARQAEMCLAPKEKKRHNPYPPGAHGLVWDMWQWFSCSVLSDSCDPIDCSPAGSSVRGFSRQEYWSMVPFPSPGDLPDTGIEPGSPAGSLLYYRRILYQLSH